MSSHDRLKTFAMLVFAWGMVRLALMPAAGQPALRSPREKINFNAQWLFHRGEIAAEAAKDSGFVDQGWQPVHLPHFPKITPLRHPWRLPDSQGMNWYRKHFRLPETYRGRKIFVEFEGADQVAEIWINGTLVLTHTGSYLPFTVDLTEHVQFGDLENVIAVRVNNFDNRDIPGYGSWISYGGLYRDAYLHVTDRLHITDAVFADKVAGGGVFVTYPVINAAEAQVSIRTHVLNEYTQSRNCRINTVLMDAEQRTVATVAARQAIAGGRDFTFAQLMRLNEFHLWHPDHPYLYTLRSEIYDGKKLVEVMTTRIGLRHLQFSPEGGFTINGERLVFMGANRVQDYPYVAWAFPNPAQKRDALRLKEAGLQYVRSSHNPQDPAFLDACDELGILVMDCIPGFQYMGGQKFREYSYQNMREVIRRDRNHPAVILWELSLNETDYDSSFARTAMRIGHEEFPGDQCFVSGWKFPAIYDVFLRATQHGARKYAEPTPLVISEYGHWDYGGGNSTSDVERRDGEADMLVQARNHQESLSLNRGLPFLCGDGLWVSMDFQSYPSGVIDYFRLPKFSYYFYQSQRDPRLMLKNVDSGPMVYIANYWTEKSPRTVKVYSNCERVDLFLNGRLLASQSPDTGAATENLLHPPFTFSDLRWQAGELRAAGYLNDREVAAHLRRTPGAATALALSFDLKGEAVADGEDMLFAYAAVVDEQGTVVPDAADKISFEVTGAGILLSPTPLVAEAGIATALIQTAGQTGRVMIRAEAQGLKAAVIFKKCTAEHD